MEQVAIKQSGNMLQITPHCEQYLGKELRYNHRIMLHGRQLIEANRAAEEKGEKPRSVRITARRVYKVEGGSLYALAGLKDRITKRLKTCGVPWEYTDLRTFTLGEPDYDYLFERIPGLTFRRGQEDVLALLIGKDYGQIVAPTGWGKSFLVRCLSYLYREANIIVVEPSKALQSMMYVDLVAHTPNVGRVGGGKNKPNRITVCIDRSLRKAPIDKCDILLFDECHKAGAPQTSEVLAQIRHPEKRFGFTATPSGRSDGGELAIEALLGPAIYWIPYDDAVADGSVAPMKVMMLKLREGEVASYNSSDGLTSRVSKKRRCYWRNNARNRTFAEGVEKAAKKFALGPDPQVLLLVETMEHAVHLLKHCPEYAFVYGSSDEKRIKELIEAELLPEGYISLKDADRERMRQDFEGGKLRRVIATGCWGTGVNFVNLDILGYVSGEPGQIPVVQWGGRNSRIREGKEFGVILDCTDQFDGWAAGRGTSRRRQYKRQGWSIVQTGVGKYAEDASVKWT